jgi:hypothetical protein
MGYDGKYGTVATEFGDIPDDEPVVVFRARDALLCPLLSAYHKLCELHGSPPRHLSLIEASYARVSDWQEAHPGQDRIPSSAGSVAWMGGRLSVRDDGTQ